MGQARVLVVDDELAIREMLKEALEDCGYECATAPDGASALGMLSQRAFDLMLLDVMMPGGSGVELFRRVGLEHQGVAVVFMTAVADPALAAEVLRWGASGYIVKPASLATLEEVVARALAERQAIPT